MKIIDKLPARVYHRKKSEREKEVEAFIKSKARYAEAENFGMKRENNHNAYAKTIERMGLSDRVKVHTNILNQVFLERIK